MNHLRTLPLLLAGLLLLEATQVSAQTAVTPDPAGAAANDAAANDSKEQYDLSVALSEAGASSIDQIRAMELHLKKYPDSKQRPTLEKNLLKAAAETNDTARIILYGERVLDRETPPDRGDTLDLLDRVARALVEKNDSDPPERIVENAKRAILYAVRYENDVEALRAKMEPPGHLTSGQWSEELDKGMARSQALEARATGYAGDPAAAQKIAARSWKSYPTGEGARENAFWLEKLGRKTEAMEFYADAFTLEDKSTTEADRAGDRKRLGQLYSGLNGSEKGLGDLILAAYDRTSALMAGRRADLKAKDPNAEAVNLADFILPPIDKTAQSLALSTLKGKTVVMDFWATWCVPCRAQQPLIQNVEKHFANATDVLFVPVDSDDDLSLVAPFVKEQGWKHAGYFEAGLARRFNIASIPTVLIIDPGGRISSRMIGFIPERFEQMLTERVDEARSSATTK